MSSLKSSEIIVQTEPSVSYSNGVFVHFEKTHPNAKIPTINPEKPFLLDIYSLDYQRIKPLDRALIKTGIRVKLYPGYSLQITDCNELRNKGSHVLTEFLSCEDQFVDINVMVQNLNGQGLIELIANPNNSQLQYFGSDFDTKVKPGQKIATAIISEIFYPLIKQ